MALEDFEKQLAHERVERKAADSHKRKRSRSPYEQREHRHRHHRSSYKQHESECNRAHKSHRSRRTDEDDNRGRRRRPDGHGLRSPSQSGEDQIPTSANNPQEDSALDILKARDDEGLEKPQRMSWMQGPATSGIEHVRSKRPKTPPGRFKKGSAAPTSRYEDQVLSVNEDAGAQRLSAPHNVDYTFGDAGSQWRMKKLNGVYREANDSGRPVDEFALNRYGNLRDFDDAREEETEMDRRKIYGTEYVGKDRPSGDLYEERKLDAGYGGQRHERADPEYDNPNEGVFETAQAEVMKETPASSETIRLDQTVLNRLKADVIRAKLRKAPDAAELEAKYNDAMASAATPKEPDVVVLDKMENRMLAGGRKGEVEEISGKRGRERGLVKENEDMSIDDMIRQERRTKGQFGGEGRAFAERIAKDGKFDDDLEYMDDNAEKLAKTVQRSDINLRNTSINEYQKMKKILDACPLCSHEDTGTPPQAPIVSLGTRTFLTLPTAPEITPYGFCASIVPTEHRLNLLECDDDEWEEIRNFMKSLTRFYYSLKPKRSVIFYENAAHEGRKRHASLEAVPLPTSVAEMIPQYFKEAILSTDEEWTQHKKIIDTLRNSERPGFGKHAFRKSMVSELPYFHVWFRIDGGLGHVVEDTRRWPKGDLFAREIIGGTLDVGHEIIRKQGRWRRGDPELQARVDSFKKVWDQWDWTKALYAAS